MHSAHHACTNVLEGRVPVKQRTRVWNFVVLVSAIFSIFWIHRSVFRAPIKGESLLICCTLWREWYFWYPHSVGINGIITIASESTKKKKKKKDLFLTCADVRNVWLWGIFVYIECTIISVYIRKFICTMQRIVWVLLFNHFLLNQSGGMIDANILVTRIF